MEGSHPVLTSNRSKAADLGCAAQNWTLVDFVLVGVGHKAFMENSKLLACTSGVQGDETRITWL